MSNTWFRGFSLVNNFPCVWREWNAAVHKPNTATIFLIFWKHRNIWHNYTGPRLHVMPTWFLPVRNTRIYTGFWIVTSLEMLLVSKSKLYSVKQSNSNCRTDKEELKLLERFVQTSVRSHLWMFDVLISKQTGYCSPFHHSSGTKMVKLRGHSYHMERNIVWTLSF